MGYKKRKRFGFKRRFKSKRFFKRTSKKLHPANYGVINRGGGSF